MNLAEAVIEYLRVEVVPRIAGESGFTAAVLSGALRTGKKRIAEKIESYSMLSALGVTDEQGNADADAVADFFDGAFEGREKINAPFAELFKIATGVESESELLEGDLIFTRKDADKFLEILKRR
jgi:hypothetical protein